jgi:hypothetical protein
MKMTHVTPITYVENRKTYYQKRHKPGEKKSKLIFYQLISRKANIYSDNYISFSIKNQTILLRTMKDYSDFPPSKYFMRVIKNCPKSAFLYILLWQKKNKHTSLSVQKKEIRKDFLISPTMFRNLLAPLMFLNLIGFMECSEKFQIDIHGPRINE